MSSRMSDTPPVAAVDVLMTAFNAQATIAESVMSILNQDHRDLRMIVVDDGSQDETWTLLSQMAAGDRRLLPVRQENRGIVDAANYGLSLCNSEFVARLDADDIAFANRLSRQLQFLRQTPACVAVSCLAYHIDVQGRRLGSIAGKMPKKVDPLSIPSQEPYIMHPFVMIRRAALKRVGGYRYVDYSEDTDLYWRLLEVGRLEVIDDFLGEYRIHAGSISSSSIVNGRISAMNSQLAAISAQRRRNGVTDLVFSASDLPTWRAARQVETILARVRQKLTDAEFNYLQLSMGAKLLELNSYRPYELELSDCVTIKRIMMAHRDQVKKDLPLVKRSWAIAFARLIRKGYVRRAAALYDGCILLDGLKNLSIQLVARILPHPLRRMYRQAKSRLYS